MNVLIRGMEMPTKCADCKFCVEGDGGLLECVCKAEDIISVLVEDDNGKPFDFRPDWCPLTEVPRTAQPWVSVSERLPEVGEDVLLSTTKGTVCYGYREVTETLWQVKDGERNIWVYDPQSYVNDIDSLPQSEDCTFHVGEDYMCSVTAVNYKQNKKFEAVIAWCPLPEPYKEGDHT